MNARLWATLAAMTASTAMFASCASTPMTEARESGWDHFGAEVNTRRPVKEIGQLEGDESNIIVQGEIVDVCPKKGCWMKVTDGSDELFVRFQDYSFFVPLDAAGRQVVMNGTAVTEIASVEDLRHYAEDAGQSAEEIAKITEPETRTTFFANSVYIK